MSPEEIKDVLELQNKREFLQRKQLYIADTVGRETNLQQKTINLLSDIYDLRMYRGYSIREISTKLGICKATVSKVAPKISISDAMKRKHERWKEAGTPVLPPKQPNQVVR